MFKKILIATDLSEASSHVIRCLRGLKKLGTKEVVLAHALGIKHLDYLKYQWTEAAKPQLLAQKKTLEGQGFKVKSEIAINDPAWEINNLAIKERASLVVLGTHGKSLIGHALLGGVATEMLQTIRKSLLVIRLQIKEKNTGTECRAACVDFSKRVLYATDFSDTAQKAFLHVEKIVENGCKQVTLIHVQDKSRIAGHLAGRLKEFNRIDRERMEMLKNRLLDKGARKVDILLPYGAPISEILKETKKKGYSLIVMGSQGRGFLKELFLGSVSHNVVRHSNLPVLLVPAGK